MSSENPYASPRAVPLPVPDDSPVQESRWRRIRRCGSIGLFCGAQVGASVAAVCGAVAGAIYLVLGQPSAEYYVGIVFGMVILEGIIGTIQGAAAGGIGGVVAGLSKRPQRVLVRAMCISLSAMLGFAFNAMFVLSVAHPQVQNPSGTVMVIGIVPLLGFIGGAVAGWLISRGLARVAWGRWARELPIVESKHGRT